MDQKHGHIPKDDSLAERYERVSRNVDFNRMMHITLLVIGTGAIGHALEQLVRLGIKFLHLFDIKRVRLKNMVAQNFCHSDVGQPKTEAIKKRLEQCEFEKGNSDIPPLEIHTHGDFLTISDDEIKEIIENERAAGRQIVILMSSDNHPVQARGNRMAIKFNIPVFWVGIYRMGMAGEIIFYVPDHDLPCYRCITESRYQFYDKNRLLDHLKGHSLGAARSFGLPMAASFIDAVLSHLIVGSIHRNDEANQHGRLFRRLLDEKRNLIQCQLDPDYRLNDSENIFAQIKGSDQIAFNTLFIAESKDFDCIDCKVRNLWQHTDYTKENYRELLEQYSLHISAFMHGGTYRHPLLDAYADLFSVWEAEYPDSE